MTKKRKIIITSLVLAGVIAGVTSIAAANTNSKWQKHSEEAKPFHQNDRNLEVKAELLGYTVEELEAKLDAGQTMKDIFDSSDLTKEDIQEKMHSIMKIKAEEKLAEALANGDITEEQAEEIKIRMAERQIIGDRGKGRRFKGFQHEDCPLAQ